MTGPAELLGSVLLYLDWAGVAVFACSGALVAAAKKQTLVTLIFFAVVTGVGGGTARDLLIGAPVFWVNENGTLIICFAAALAVWALPGALWQGRALPWLDAVGIAAYATYGAAKGLAFGLAPLPALAMGVLTACLGGIIRDVLAGEPSILMRPELYVTAAALSAALMVGLLLAGVPAALAGLVAASAGFMLRAGAIHFGWKLPAYSREDRHSGDRRNP
ncbi:MAG TPA: trimeric intracellular cation channel family protein [Allosphingosinicella sp.]|nr:trimeric intracellular cation channel family protein [Allosphingosinicella sp.]